VSDPVFTLTRAFDLVWKVHSEVEHLAKWWGPAGFDWVSGALDFRPGGIFHYCMRAPDGHAMWGKFQYREIAPKSKIVFASSFSDEAGMTTRAPFAANFPLAVLNTVTFAAIAGKTTLRIMATPVDASDEEKAFFESMFASMNQGFNGTLDKLDRYLKILNA
jgi:uncharacterized protein YndB with AHSA1/START domain